MLELELPTGIQADRDKERQPRYDNVCLLFTYGFGSLGMEQLDSEELRLISRQHGEENSDPLLIYGVHQSTNGEYDLSLFEEGYLIERAHVNSISEVVAVGQEIGVSWVAPTSHATNTLELAKIAESLGLPYVSPVSVENVDNKIKFYKILEAADIPVLPYYQSDNADEILNCVDRIDGPSVLKAENATSGKSQQLIYPGMSLRDREHLVKTHVEVRDHYNLGTTIVQIFAGDDEFGYQTILLATDQGLQMPWSMTTRKHMITPEKILIDHVFDSTNKRHAWDTTRLIQPTMRDVVLALNAEEPSEKGLPSTPLNADLLKWKGVAYPIDASFRWMPRALRESNATLGLDDRVSYFTDLAIELAHGKKIYPEDIVPFGPQRRPRAFINRRAFTEGGVLVQHRPVDYTYSRESFYSELPIAGTRIPSPGNASNSRDQATYPLICTEGVDIAEAERRWRVAMAKTGLAIVNGSVKRGYSIGKNNQGRKWGRHL